jgi:hypothetical protein
MSWESNSYDADLMQQDTDWFGSGADTLYNDSLSAGQSGTLGDWQGWGNSGTGSDLDYNSYMSGLNYSPDPSMNFNMNLNNSAGGGYSMPLGGASNSLTPQMQAAPSTNSWIQQLMQNPDKMMKGLAALYEGNQNKKYGSALNKIAQNPAFDPFGSQRPFYQDQLRSAITNPMQAPIVAQQLKGIQEAQNRKDAAAGRRSNVVGSAPAVMQAQGQVMQNYINSLMQPAGAGMSPNSSALAQLFQNAAKSNTQGYASPAFSAMGQMSQDDLLRALIAKL